MRNLGAIRAPIKQLLINMGLVCPVPATEMVENYSRTIDLFEKNKHKFTGVFEDKCINSSSYENIKSNKIQSGLLENYWVIINMEEQQLVSPITLCFFGCYGTLMCSYTQIQLGWIIDVNVSVYSIV